MMEYLQMFREMISLRGLADHTLKSYCTYIGAYLDYLERFLHKAPEEASWGDMRDFIRWLQKSRGLRDRTVNCAISQLRFFTMYVLHKPWDSTQLPMRRFDTYLPFVPSQKETWQFITTMPDLKPRAMLTVLYSAGLRIGEVCTLRYEDISREQKRIHVAPGKNRTARYAILSDEALAILTQYWFAYGKPKGYLFPGPHNPDQPIYKEFLPNAIRAHEARLGWEHRLTCHAFRHAFGTHLYENGVDLFTIKALLGHKSLNSTAIYVHLAANGTQNAVSPFDCMRKKYHD